MKGGRGEEREQQKESWEVWGERKGCSDADQTTEGESEGGEKGRDEERVKLGSECWRGKEAALERERKKKKSKGMQEGD